MEQLKSRRKDFVLCTALAVFTFWLIYRFSLRGADPHHDGVMFETALKVANGALLYKETFTQYGSLAVYIFAAAIRLFGPTLRSIQIAACMAYAGCYCLIYTITKKVTDRAVAAVTAALSAGLSYVFFWHAHPWSSVLALLFQLAAVELTLQAVRGGRLWKFALAGALAGCAFWCRLPVGLLTGVCGLLAILALQAARPQSVRTVLGRVLAYLAGFLAVMLLFFVPLLATGRFEAWYGMCVRGTTGFAAESGGTPTSFVARLGWCLVLAPAAKFNPLFDWIWLLPVVCMGLVLLAVFGPVLLARVKRPRAPLLPAWTLQKSFLLVIGVYCGGSWAQYYPVSDYRHWYWAALPMFPLLAVCAVWLAQKLRRRLPDEKTTLLACGLLVLLSASNLGLRGYWGAAKLNYTDAKPNPEATRPGITEFYAEEDWVDAPGTLYVNPFYPYLNGLYLSNETAVFYDELFSVMAQLKAIYPEKNVWQRTNDGFYGVFQTEYMPYGDAPYSAYTEIENEYIRTQKPVLITQSPSDIKTFDCGYRLYARISGCDGRMENATVYILLAD